MKNKKIFSMIIIFILVIVLFANISIVYAKNPIPIEGESSQGLTKNPISKAWDAAQGFTKNGKSNTVNYPNLYTVMNFIYNIAMFIGIVVAMFVGIKLGMQIILGSIDEKADAKHLLVPYIATVIGGACALTIWKIATNIIYNLI